MSVTPQSAKNKKVNESVMKALQVLEYVCKMDKDVRVVDLESALNINKATVYRFLRTFVETGYVEQDVDTSRYRPTMKILALGNHVMNRVEIRNLASNFIKELSHVSGESVHLAVCDANQSVIMDKVDAKIENKVTFHIGRRSDLYSTGTGKVFLAHMPFHEMEKYFHNVILTRFTSMTIIDPEQIKQALIDIRECGYAIDRQENNIGISCVAGPIRDYSEKVVASVSVTGPSSRIEHDISRLSKLIIEYSQKISHRMGYGR